MPTSLCAREGKLADFSAALVQALFAQDVDIHVALPDYRSLFNNHADPIFQQNMTRLRNQAPDSRIHLAEDRAFFYKNSIYSESNEKNMIASIVFQREVINTIIPRVQPDLIHCNDWTTGLIPAMARQMGIPCLFTVHSTHTVKTVLSFIEDKGIDAAVFWQHLFYEQLPLNYEETRGHNAVNFLASGIFAAHHANTSQSGLLEELIQKHHQPVHGPIQIDFLNKVNQECALRVQNTSDTLFSSETDPYFELYDKILRRPLIAA